MIYKELSLFSVKKKKQAKKHWEKSYDLSTGSPDTYFNIKSIREYSLEERLPDINSYGDYSDKCHQLWNNFDKPTRVTMAKYPVSSGIIRAQKSKINYKLEYRPKKNIMSKEIKATLPPIKRIYSKIANPNYLENWEVDSDEEDSFMRLNKY